VFPNRASDRVPAIPIPSTPAAVHLSGSGRAERDAGRPGEAQPRTAGVPRTPEPRSSTMPARLTMRGRLLLVVVAVAVMLLLLPGLARGDGPDRPTRAAYTVEAGDTLWAIARRVAPGRDPREVVDQLVRDNRLHGSLQVGQQLLVPTG
jgi:nucleoid-associated protein YgaU